MTNHRKLAVLQSDAAIASSKKFGRMSSLSWSLSGVHFEQGGIAWRTTFPFSASWRESARLSEAMRN